MVVVEIRCGRYRYVRTVAEAGKVLLKEWPDCRGKKHAAAMKAVLESLKGRHPPSTARKALVAAAREARIMPPDSFSVPEDGLPSPSEIRP